MRLNNRLNQPLSQLLAAGSAITLVASAADAGFVINVGFNAPQTTVNVGDLFTVVIVADIPFDVVGWGMRFNVQNPGVINLEDPPLVLLPWDSTPVTQHPDSSWQFGGLAFPNAVSGQGVTLAQLTFTATQLGETDLILSIDPGDLTQGFVAGPGGSSGLFPSVQLNFGHVTVVPVPGVPLIVSAMAFGSARRGRRRGPNTLPR